MDKPNRPARSYLFTVRLWAQDSDSDQVQWRGLVQHVLSGEYRYFKSWDSLEAFCMEVLARPQTASSTGEILD